MSIPKYDTLLANSSPSPSLSTSIHLDGASDSFPTHRTVLELFGAFDAGTDVSAIVKEAINVLLITDLAELLLVLRHQILHSSSPVPSTRFEPTHIGIPSLGVHHRPLTVHTIILPVPLIHVMILKVLPTFAISPASHEISLIRVAVEVREGTWAMPLAILGLPAAGVIGEVFVGDEAF